MRTLPRRDLRRRLRLPLRADDQLAERFWREQPRNVGDLHRRLEARFRNLGQITPELRKALLRDDAFLLELRLRQIAACVLDDLAARYLDLERALKPKHHVEKVDRFGVQALDQRDIRFDVLDV